MSVQVRRRREAASFLSTYVGAQGELLVDTTNNRVQVHDGTTPGGNPAAGIDDVTGRNVFANGTFRINQRAYASGAALAAGAYAHDRWKAGAGGCTYTFSQTVPDTTITITAGSLLQVVEATSVYATAFWLSWTGSASARVWQGTPTGAFGAGSPSNIAGIAVNTLLVTGLTAGATLAAEFSAGTLGLVQLEAALPNAGPTRFERRPLAQELAICQRYYATISASLQFYSAGGGTTYRQSTAINYPNTMRASPTAALQSPVYANSATPSVQGVNATGLVYNIDPTAAGAVYVFQYVTLSAEL